MGAVLVGGASTSTDTTPAGRPRASSSRTADQHSTHWHSGSSRAVIRSELRITGTPVLSTRRSSPSTRSASSAAAA
uniref:hypothetical protein n=1 Tax=Actinacidiphila rubida TaxID=310780 RepID=UPI00114CD8C7